MIEEKKSQKFLIIISILIFLTLCYLVIFQKEWLDDTIFGERKTETLEEIDFNEDGDIVLEEETKGVELSFNPESGTISSEEIKVEILIDMFAFEPSGIEVELEFSGGEYKFFENGDIEGCDVIEEEKENSMYFFCLFPHEVEIQQTGIFATLNFENISDELTISVKESKAGGIPVNYSDVTYIIE